eukprot:1156532-Pelagomonas_calceolata.AAC.8
MSDSGTHSRVMRHSPPPAWGSAQRCLTQAHKARGSPGALLRPAAVLHPVPPAQRAGGAAQLRATGGRKHSSWLSSWSSRWGTQLKQLAKGNIEAIACHVSRSSRCSALPLKGHSFSNPVHCMQEAWHLAFGSWQL